MFQKILPAVLVAGLALSGAAQAGTMTTTAPVTTPAAKVATPVAATSAEVSGVIKKVNLKHRYIVLDNGVRYHLAKGFEISGLKRGEKVQVTYTVKGKVHEASMVKAM